MTMIFIYTLDAKRPDSGTKLCEFSSKTVQRYNMHTIQKKRTEKHISNILRLLLVLVSSLVGSIRVVYSRPFSM